MWPRNDNYYLRNNWAGKLKSANGDWVLDSPFNNAVAHQVNAIAFLAGEELWESAKIKNVVAVMYRTRNIESADTVCARIETENGIPLFFAITHAAKENHHPHIEVIGENGRITWDIFGEMHIKTATIDMKMPAQDGDKCRMMVTNALINKVRGENQFIYGLNIALMHTIIVNGIHESAEIINIPSAFISELYDENNVRLSVINDIDNIFTKAIDNMKLFSENGISWAKTGKKIDVTDYVKGVADFPRGEIL